MTTSPVEPTPGRFTAPVAGLYHFAIGREPHLESECTDDCPVGAVGAPLMASQTVDFVVEPIQWPPREEDDILAACARAFDVPPEKIRPADA